MPRRNRVDPFGDLHATPERGMFTGNRGCLVNEQGEIVRHHKGSLWITCVLSYRDWTQPLAQPGHWTPLFFLDDSVALAAGHRPCGLCRRDDYRSYQRALTNGLGATQLVAATEQNRILARERLRRGRGLNRAVDRKTWSAELASLPNGSVIVRHGKALLVKGDWLWEFDFSGWRRPSPRSASGNVEVLTPQTSVIAIQNGYVPRLHGSIEAPEQETPR